MFNSLLTGTISGALVKSALAQNDPTITVDENGNGSLLFAGSPTTPLTGVLAPDPGPGGGASALTYNLLGPPGLIGGDLLIHESDSSMSDLVRFNPAGTGGSGYHASLVFYSIPGGGDLADTSSPTSLYTNQSSLTEGADGVTTYTPTANEPGFVPGFGVTYVIQSSPAGVPDAASSFALLSVGLSGLVFFRRMSR